MDPVHHPAAISTTMVTMVTISTQRVRASPRLLPLSNWWLCCQGDRSWA